MKHIQNNNIKCAQTDCCKTNQTDLEWQAYKDAYLFVGIKICSQLALVGF